MPNYLSSNTTFLSHQASHIPVYYASGGCVDDVVNNQANYQFVSVIVIHFMNGAGACWIIRRTVFNVYVSV